MNNRVLLVTLWALAGCGAAVAPTPGPNSLTKINHIVVLYLENRSFDNLYGEFPGAEGIQGLKPEQYQQTDSLGNVYATLPQISTSRIPAGLPNAPFAIDQYVPNDQATIDLVHRYYQEQMQINGGKMDRFVAVSNAKGLAIGYYETKRLPMIDVAKQYTLLDHFFHGAFGGSMLNHIYLVSAAAAEFPNAPDAQRAQLDAQGRLIRDGAVTPDGFVVNSDFARGYGFTVNTPHPAHAQLADLIPSQTMPTIGDRLSDKGISWAWYSQGWNGALAGRPDSAFRFHHQPFAYFARYADGTAAKAEHLKDQDDFFAAARAGTLPAVSFVKPWALKNEHPGDADLLAGEQHTIELIDAVRNGPNWNDAVIIVTYDEHGGFWDHVAPPTRDRWGPGSRVPTIIISPFVKRGYVDHTTYETASILAFIEHRFGLAPLNGRDAAAQDFSAAFNF